MMYTHMNIIYSEHLNVYIYELFYLFISTNF